MQAEHEQIATGDASWPRASSVPAREDRSGEGYWGVEVDWSDHLRSSVLGRSYSIPPHPPSNAGAEHWARGPGARGSVRTP